MSRAARSPVLRPAAIIAVLAMIVAILPISAAAADDPRGAELDGVLISETANGGVGGSFDNYIEVTNFGDAAIDVTGWEIYRCFGSGSLAGSPQVPALPSLVLQPGDTYLIAHADSTLTQVADALYSGNNSLANGGFGVLVLDAQGDTVDRFAATTGNPDSPCAAGEEFANSLTFADDEAYQRISDDGNNATDFSIGTRSVSGGHQPPGDGDASTSEVVIEEMATRGPGQGTDNFVLLRNVSTRDVDISGWRIERCNNTGTGFVGTQVTIATGTSLAPAGTFLAAHATGYTGDAVPDATYGVSIADNGGARVVDTDGTVIDGIGFGTNANNCTQGTPPPPLTAAQGDDALAYARDAQSTNTANNASDFSLQPRSVDEPNGDDPTDPEDPFDPELCEIPASDLTVINQIQGDSTSTPLAGQTVTTRGVVTTDFTSGGASGLPANQGLRGFFIEAVSGDRDDDPQTSEGLFVFDASGAFDGQPGDLVHVTGTASEFPPGDDVTVTQVSASGFAVCNDTGVDTQLPAPAALPLPVAPEDRSTILEPLESMRVTHPELTVTEFFQLERFGELRLSGAGVLQTPTNVFRPGTSDAVDLAAANAAATIILADGRTGQNLDPLPYVEPGGTLRIGDQLLDHTTVLHYGFGEWRLQPIDIDAITAELATNRTRPRPETVPDVGGSLTVASFNVLNYFNGDGQGGGFPTARGARNAEELERQTEKLVDAIVRMEADVYGLIEMENDGGEFQATAALVEAINAELESEQFAFVDTGVIGSDAIKQAIIYRPETVTPVGDFAILTSDIDPRFNDQRSRPPLAQTFEENATGERFTVVVNHLKSKGSSCAADGDPDLGDGQANCNLTRTLAAEAMADWLATDPTGAGGIGDLIIGDLNAYGREDPIIALEDAGYQDQLIRFTDGIPYTYTFDGQQGTLDTALALDSLAERVTGAAAWQINADEVPAIDYQLSGPGSFRTAEVAEIYYDPSAFRSSDHDPVLIGLELTPAPPAMPTSKDQCKQGGWQDFSGFRNQGQCVAYVASGQLPRPGRP